MKSINIKGRLYDLDGPLIMAIINTAPDSFFEDSRVTTVDKILSRCDESLKQGASILDIGGYSSRPGAENIPIEEEIKRTIEPIKQIRASFPEAILSIDTFRSEVAGIALEHGVDMINDISGGQLDKKMHRMAGSYQVPYIAMHMRGNPQTMSSLSNYKNILKEISLYFAELIESLEKENVKDIILDPGFGFAKTLDQNYEILRGLDYLHALGRPLLVGLSRKSMIFRLLGIGADEALNGTTVLNIIALQKKASILRVHDVKPALEVVRIMNKINQ